MEKEYFWSGSVQLKLPGNVADISGGIIYPIGVGYHSLMRRDIDTKYPHLTRRLLDPQLYLVRLDPYTCRKKCAYLATYPWFPIKSFEPFNSSKHRQREWQNSLTKNVHKLWIGKLPKEIKKIETIIAQCLQIQANLNCENFILPSPLTVDQTTDYATELQWLDAGFKKSNQINSDIPILATIAISDSALRLIEPWQNDMIDLIIDQVSSREPDGAYIVLEQSNEKGYYCTHHNTVGCLLRLVYGLKAAGLRRVVISYTGTAGFLCILAGADIWSSGWYKSERKLKLSDIEDSEGRAFPAYYSHNFASEIHLEDDLDDAYTKGLWPDIREITPASKPLDNALNKGRKVSDVAEWKYRSSNVTAAKEHFVYSAINHTREVSNLSRNELFTYGIDWLLKAKNIADRISQFNKRHERTAVTHQSSWYEAFVNFVNKIS